jgi:hypothetical protein
MPNDSRRRIQRDRHDRGLRGPLVPHSLPKHSSPDASFRDLVLRAITELDRNLGDELKHVTFKVEAIPNAQDAVLSGGAVSLGRIERGNPHVVVLYQRAIELRSESRVAQNRIIKDVLAELLGRLLGLTPQEVDYSYQQTNR